MHLRNMTLYSIFVRNDGGSFRAVQNDLPRLRALGVDAVWLLPIHPIGTEKRKGTLGSRTRSATTARSIRNTVRWKTSSRCATPPTN